MKPETRYTKSGSINIAYQVFGTGPTDLVYIPGWVSNIDLMWACPELVDFLSELGKIARVILFDKRGTGLSDRIVELSTIEERMDDIRAVMDAVGSQKAILFGHSEGGSVSALFAATYPNRTIALIAFGIFAKRRYAPDYPWAPTDEERQQVYDMIETSWGSGNMQLESLAPSKAADKRFMDWLANYFRSGASPSAAMVLTKMNTQVDIVDVLSSIKVPTLLMQRTGDIDVKIDEGRFIAERIENAKFVEFGGNDHLFWVGNTGEVLDEMIAFIRGADTRQSYEERLFTIVAAQVRSGHKEHIDLPQLFDRIAAQYRGKTIPYQGTDTFISIFEGPSKAVHCSVDLANLLRSFNVDVSIGIHIREGTINETHFISAPTEAFITALLAQAGVYEIVITPSVKALLSGAGLQIAAHKRAVRLSTGELVPLFMVVDHLRTPTSIDHLMQVNIPRHDSFLENVLQVIENHFQDDLFGVERLCQEVGMSERQLQRKLKAVTNKTPNQLISSVRLHRARQLLLDQKSNVAEVAFQTGYTSPSYFTKCFKREFGESPSSLVQKLVS